MTGTVNDRKIGNEDEGTETVWKGEGQPGIDGFDASEGRVSSNKLFLTYSRQQSYSEKDSKSLTKTIGKQDESVM